MKKKISWWVIVTSAIVGLSAVLLTHFGNPANMGFCIACFLRDIAGSLGLHSAGKVQYVRPEIIGLVLGAFVMSVCTKEFRAKSGSAPALRFVLGAFVMIGALAFLGCPLRMVLRLAGGDANALVGLVGFGAGIFAGTLFLKKGFSLKRSYDSVPLEGVVLPVSMTVILLLFLTVPVIFKLSEAGPGSKHAPVWLALALSMVIGALAQRSRLCMAGGIRDAVMFGDFKLLSGFVAIFLVALIGNLVTKQFHWGFQLQPIAHSSHVWNFLGMTLVGWGSVLLAAARCVSSFWPAAATATPPSPCSACSPVRRLPTTLVWPVRPTPRTPPVSSSAAACRTPARSPLSPALWSVWPFPCSTFRNS